MIDIAEVVWISRRMIAPGSSRGTMMCSLTLNDSCVNVSVVASGVTEIVRTISLARIGCVDVPRRNESSKFDKQLGIRNALLG